MEKKYQIFISSTYNDLIAERKEVQDAILSMEQFPIGMEYFSASSEHQWKIIQRAIDSSDYYVLIIGYRYGSELPSGISYTEREFDYACKKKIPILVFLKQEGIPTIKEHIELDSEKQKKLKSFIEKSKTGREVAWWSTKEELAQEVTKSLYKEFVRNERLGWVRVTEDYYKEIDILKKENILLREEIEQLKKNSKYFQNKSNGLLINREGLLLQNHGENPQKKIENINLINYFDKKDK